MYLGSAECGGTDSHGDERIGGRGNSVELRSLQILLSFTFVCHISLFLFVEFAFSDL